MSRFACWERLPFADAETQFVLRFRGQTCTIWDSASTKTRDVATLEDGLYGIILESRATSMLIPAFLFGESEATDLLQFASVGVRAEEVRDGVSAWRLDAQHARLGQTRLWIDQATMALMRLEYVADAQVFSFSPRVDQPVAEPALDELGG